MSSTINCHSCYCTGTTGAHSSTLSPECLPIESALVVTIGGTGGLLVVGIGGSMDCAAVSTCRILAVRAFTILILGATLPS